MVEAEESTAEMIMVKKKEVLKKSMNYTKLRHYKRLSKIIDLF